jgi:DNA-binding response OmpR family regulator
MQADVGSLDRLSKQSEVLMHHGRILIVDDDDKARDFLKAFLNYKGYHVIQACDAQEAFKLLEVNEVDLVFTDLMMPRVNGLEFLKKLKAVRPDVVTIVCSAFSTNDMTANLLKAGAFFCLNKPFNPRAAQHRAPHAPGQEFQGETDD